MGSELDFVVSKMQEANITQLAQDTRISRMTLYRIKRFDRENPEHWPRSDHIEKLRDYFRAQESAA